MSVDFFSKLTLLFIKMFQEYHQSAKQFRFYSVGPDLGSNCLQMITTQETGRQRVQAENRNLLVHT